MAKRLLSVVVPIYNEEGLLDEFYRRLTGALAPLSDRYRLEFIFVDDGSADRSLEMLRALADSDPRVRALSFSRNFGHQIAITAGIDYARGDAVVAIDGDLQDPPEVIAGMVAKWEEGYEVVYGVRERREGESAFKRQTAHIFYRVLNRISDLDLPEDAGDFRLMDRLVVDQLVAMREQSRYIRGMVTWIGFRQYALPYRRDARFSGHTKYTLRKMMRLALDGVTSFSAKPLAFPVYVGTALCGVALVYLIALLATGFSGGLAAGAATGLLIVLVLFLGGLQLVAIGALGAYVERIFRESKGRPLYVVARRFGADSEEPAAPVSE